MDERHAQGAVSDGELDRCRAHPWLDVDLGRTEQAGVGPCLDVDLGSGGAHERAGRGVGDRAVDGVRHVVDRRSGKEGLYVKEYGIFGAAVVVVPAIEGLGLKGALVEVMDQAVAVDIGIGVLRPAHAEKQSVLGSARPGDTAWAAPSCRCRPSGRLCRTEYSISVGMRSPETTLACRRGFRRVSRVTPQSSAST